MRNTKIYIILSILFIIAALVAYNYYFGIYEVVYSVDHKRLYADGKSIATIKVVPINSIGIKVPFRYSAADFVFIEGEDLVDIIAKDSKAGTLTLKAKDKPGKVIIRVKSEHSLLPSEIEILIEPNLV